LDDAAGADQGGNASGGEGGDAMSDRLTERLNAILPKITSPEFLSGSGIGNEIAFYIFDYSQR
jgi:hypothetical protein